MTNSLAVSQKSRKDRPWRLWFWLSCGVGLLGLMIAAAIEGRSRPVWVDGPAGIGPLTILSVAAGAVYLIAVLLAPRGRLKAWQIILLVLVAVGMRLPMWLAPPVHGWDYCRYFWDGALTASGVNPYRYSPQQVVEGRVSDPKVARTVQQGQEFLEGINHPHLRTLYPPIAQGIFAAAYWLKPFDLTAWRLVLLAFDAAAAALVILLLRRAGLPVAMCAIYLWNPVLVSETYFYGHVDLALGAVVLLFAWALVSRRIILAGVVLALAVGIKLWPALLIFFLIRQGWAQKRKLVLSLVIFCLLLGLMAIPYLAAFGSQGDSGLLTYSSDWQWRHGAYALFARLGWWLKWVLHLSVEGRMVGRGLMMLVLLAVAVWQGMRRDRNAKSLCASMAVVGVMMLLLGPTLWPWYYVGLLGLVAVGGCPVAALAWAALLPLANLPEGSMPEGLLVCLLHMPIWILLAVQYGPRLLAGLGEVRKPHV